MEPAKSPLLRWMIVAAVACTLHGQDRSGTIQQLYTEAKSAETAGHPEDAVQKYEQILRLSPDLAAAHNNLGKLYYQAGQFEKAIPELERACKLDGHLEPPRALLGFAYFQMRKFEQARDELKIASALNPSDHLAKLFLARSYIQTGELKPAEEVLVQLRDQEPKNAEVLFALGSVYSSLAEDTMVDIQSVDPNSYLIEVMLAKVAEAKGLYSEAVEHYKKAIERAPQVSDLYYQYGHALWVSKDDADALEAYRHALALNPYDYRAQWETARIIWMKAPVQAVQLVTEALRLEPNLPEALKTRGQALMAMSQTQAAIEDLKKSIALDPKDATTHYQLARAYRQAGLLAQAKAEDSVFMQLQSTAPGAAAHP